MPLHVALAAPSQRVRMRRAGHYVLAVGNPPRGLGGTLSRVQLPDARWEGRAYGWVGREHESSQRHGDRE